MKIFISILYFNFLTAIAFATTSDVSWIATKNNKAEESTFFLKEKSLASFDFSKNDLKNISYIFVPMQNKSDFFKDSYFLNSGFGQKYLSVELPFVHNFSYIEKFFNILPSVYTFELHGLEKFWDSRAAFTFHWSEVDLTNVNVSLDNLHSKVSTKKILTFS
ncbi:hypothetical protein AB834_02475 [PVC group bacterium (ex Bugula neritina AB1)]|nr:hypothetical protein AB834_02475 [PVC group bacterium (ex Bugula neritina AB1)]